MYPLDVRAEKLSMKDKIDIWTRWVQLGIKFTAEEVKRIDTLVKKYLELPPNSIALSPLLGRLWERFFDPVIPELDGKVYKLEEIVAMFNSSIYFPNN
jgi:hypothetical protein